MIEKFFVTLICLGFLILIFLVAYLVVEIVGTCIEAIIYMMESWRRKKKGGI